MDRIFLLLVLLALTQTVIAAPIFSISPSINSTVVRSDSMTVIPYTVTNSSKTSLSGITINPNYNTSANLSISANTCANLGKGSSCTFNLVIAGQNQPTSFQVSPEICAFNQTVCSQPIASARLNVVVNNITHPVRAYVGLTNSVLPITLIAGSAGVLGSAITGFSLSEPAGIVVNPAGTTAYVTNSGTNRIFAIDTNSNQIIKMFQAGTVPAAIVTSPDGSTLYVANFNNGQSNGTLSVINALSGALLSTVSIGNGPWGIAITPDGAKIYVTNSFDNTVSVVSTATNSVIKTIGVGTAPLGVAAAPDGTKIYVANTGSNSVSVINTDNNQLITTINIGRIPKGVVVSPDSSTVYAANWQDHTISVITASMNAVTATINVAPGPLGLAVSPDGTQLYVTLDQSSAVNVVNTNTRTVQYIYTTAPAVTLGNFIG